MHLAVHASRCACTLLYMHLDVYASCCVHIALDQVFLPDDVVIQSGEIGDEMFFIAKGEVTALADDGRKIAKHQVGIFKAMKERMKS